MTLSNRRILLIVGGGIAAYKALDLTRRLRERGAAVRAVLTKAGEHFVTPLALSALTEDKVYTELFDLTDEAEMGHIQLSRSADLIIVAPATADLMAKMAHGLCGDLASTLLLATDTDVLIAPAMNVRMWEHPATRANLATLTSRGVRVAGPNEGSMACGEYGYGRMAEPLEIIAAAEAYFAERTGPLAGKKAIVTSGPTHEPIDPVRYIANRSSGKQGHAIARALAALGAEVTLVSGPTREPDPAGVKTVPIESARDMLAACEAALPADIVVCAAAVADWRVATAADQKMKKEEGRGLPTLKLAENPDILKTLSQKTQGRPALVVGFAAETEKVVEFATAKRARKGCDWILANDVSPATGTFGGDSNTIHLVTADGSEDWPAMTKAEVGKRLAARIAEHFQTGPSA
ncbi:bifunctional phosphopantothenoylcysteine decarboxylase/phosphopantothenate--cysteine ligase CoaBC [Thalassobaculum sp. OXR-137]|uniref:bifunctional phosphopantothenoylcysteine decarboxylase/phosphopantothenate--cysteine ligase CoaBC n=1 Tax=Thalassobaculum sp. OXR-137 TaxID=3100173 RepID=UPI002AC8D120|nr:bifunctional phosphopantothenoylcysteine decarboxylase/phosphopantothenate--cysteine ligase CoaBC [Thalassobaculum sp. OXR-137]WPZ34721.1 bifunctional phosphopantothenoylcysteine decarboxylase/phosphopantothenate--cysteine ligase CoaBC [Thalassobaculum sp. OXR-137]